MKRLFAFLLAAILAAVLCGCGAPDIERSDALRFKDEYELVNGQIKEGETHAIRPVSISEDNPIVYKSYSEIARMMKNGETFALYFGFATCPWCRACIETYLQCAKENGVDTIIYNDVFYTRDIYEYNENGQIECTREAGEGYFELMALLDNVLDDYIVRAADKDDYSVGEKRIYAPNFITVVNGKAVAMEESGDLMEDPYAELSDDIVSELSQRYSQLFRLLNN